MSWVLFLHFTYLSDKIKPTEIEVHILPSLTLSFPLEAEYDLNNFNVLYLNFIEDTYSLMDFCTTYLLVYNVLRT